MKEPITTPGGYKRHCHLRMNHDSLNYVPPNLYVNSGISDPDPFVRGAGGRIFEDRLIVAVTGGFAWE